jgi:hypothetical protein
MINRLNLNEPTGQTTGNNQPTASPMTHQSVTQSQSFSGSSRSSAGVHQLHPISENSSKSTEVTPPVRTLSTPARIIRSSSGGSEQINRFRPIRTDSPGYAPVATHRPPPSSSSVSRDSPHSPSPTAQLSRNSSISASSSIGLDTSFPPLPAQVLEQTDEPEVTQTQPDDIKATYQKIRNASRDLENQSETPIELVPEPPVLNLPDTFFQPKIICQLKLNDDARSESEQEGSSSSCDGPGGHGSRHSDIQEMIKKQEKAIIDFTSDREELIKESRQNELFGDEIIKIIRLKCPSILGRLQPFVEDIQSSYKLKEQLNGRMVRAEAAFKEAEHSQDTKVREACEQKVKALRAQQQEAERLNNHCKEREHIVTESLRAHLDEENFLKFQHYIKQKRTLLEEQYETEERIKGAELILKQLKET